MDYKKLREEHENFFTTISGSKDRYRDFLNSMAYHYRQPVTAQVAIFLHGAAAHRAYATEALWKRLPHRKVNRKNYTMYQKQPISIHIIVQSSFGTTILQQTKHC